MRYRRVRVPGATYFFTLVTGERRPLLRTPAAVEDFVQAVAAIRAAHPFEIEAEVILPDHLHAMWRLPEGDADFSTRWRLIKSRFTRAYLSRIGGVGALPRSASRKAKGEQSVWQRRF